MTHNVYFWLRPDLAPDEIQRFETEAAKLLKIDGIRSGFVGRPAPTPARPVIDSSYSYHLCLEFDSVEDQNTYQDHPDHHAFVEACRPLWDRVQVYDSEPI